MTLHTVNKQVVKKGLQGLKKLLEKEPEIGKEQGEERKEFQKFVAAEKRRRDTEHTGKAKSQNRK